VVAICLGAALACPFALGVLSAAPPCQQGSLVATLSDALTPWIIVDTPFAGYAEGQYTWQNGSVTNNLRFSDGENGSVFGYFEFENWSIYTEQPSGGLARCSASFEAVAHDTGTSSINGNPLDTTVQFENDSAAPTSIGSNASGIPVTYYDASFQSETFSVSTCGSGWTNLTTASDTSRFGLGFLAGGSWHILTETATISAQYFYHFPPNAGTWSVDNLSSPGGPGGGWAFSYLGPCS
jgi:hypothetical protein